MTHHHRMTHTSLLIRSLLIPLVVLLLFPLNTTADSFNLALKETQRLLILDSQHGTPYDEVRAAMLKRLAEHGYVSGRNLTVELFVAGNDVARGEQILREQADKGYDAAFVGGTIATIAARNILLGRDIPVVFGSTTDPVGIGVIDNFTDKPRTNFTGVCYPVPLSARLRFIRKLMPQAKRLGLIYADMPQSHSYNAWLREAIATDPEFADMAIIFRSVKLVIGEEGDRQMAQAAIQHIKELDPIVDAFIKPNDQMGSRRHFAGVVYANATKPLIGLTQADVMEEWGSTAVIYPSHESIGRQAADMLKQIFEGAKPADITPQWPARFGFAVDLKKTRRFGIKVPIEILRLCGKNIIK